MIKKWIIPALTLALLAAACSLPGLNSPAPEAGAGLTPMVITPQSPTSTPTPQPTPTPLPAARVINGDYDLAQGNWDLALEEYQTALNTAPDDETRAGALFGIGRIQYFRGKQADALITLTRLTNTYPNAPQLAAAYFYLGQIYYDLQRYAESASAYSRYLSLHPGIIDAYVQEKIGDAQAAAGNYIEASGAYQSALQAPKLGDGIDLEIKIANANASMGDYNTAVNKYIDIYNRTSNDYTKAELDLLAGQAYLSLGQTELAYQRYLDAVEKYPRSYDTYNALVALVNAGVSVDYLQRGIVDYYAGQYGLAIDALDNYINANPDHNAVPHYYKALALRALSRYDEEIAAWDEIIKNHANDSYWSIAWDEKAYTLWAYLARYQQAAEVMLDFVARAPTDSLAAGLLYDAGRNMERENKLDEAARIWNRMADEYPSSNLTQQALILSGVCRYRLKDYPAALTVFQRALVLAAAPGEQAQALFWIGKAQQASGDSTSAQTSWQQAATRDPTGYYSERARDLLLNRQPFTPPESFDMGIDIQAERAEAEEWMRAQFHLEADVDLSTPNTLMNDRRMWRGAEFWNLGLYEEARIEFEDLRESVKADPVNTYRLMNFFKDLGLYRSAILAARQVLSLAAMDDIGTLNAPIYFNHIRFGLYYKDIVLPAAQNHSFHPLLIFSVIRQESFFEGFVQSSAGARGLMQIMPATGSQIAANNQWPKDFTPDDLYRPYISINLGTIYLAKQRDYFGGELYPALAAYNGGPGNASAWRGLAGNDPDLFVETIRFKETRDYVMRVYETFSLYRRMYSRTP
jgi:soluble lytic murein transglycosylase